MCKTSSVSKVWGISSFPIFGKTRYFETKAFLESTGNSISTCFEAAQKSFQTTIQQNFTTAKEILLVNTVLQALYIIGR
jgi:hypothetical protein